MDIFFYWKSHEDSLETGRYQIILFACLCSTMESVSKFEGKKLSFITEFSFFLIDL